MVQGAGRDRGDRPLAEESVFAGRSLGYDPTLGGWYWRLSTYDEWDWNGPTPEEWDQIRALIEEGRPQDPGHDEDEGQD